MFWCHVGLVSTWFSWRTLSWWLKLRTTFWWVICHLVLKWIVHFFCRSGSFLYIWCISVFPTRKKTSGQFFLFRSFFLLFCVVRQEKRAFYHFYETSSTASIPKRMEEILFRSAPVAGKLLFLQDDKLSSDEDLTTPAGPSVLSAGALFIVG